MILEGSKPDVYREGRDVLISKPNSNTCPINMLLRYLSSAGIKHDSTDSIFRPISFCKSSGTYKLRKVKLSHTGETMLSALEILRLDKKQIRINSLRSAGATAAATAGVDDRLFMKHGRWKTDLAKDCDVKENILYSFSVTK